VRSLNDSTKCTVQRRRTRVVFLSQNDRTDCRIYPPNGYSTCISFLENKSIRLVADRLSLSSLPKLRTHRGSRTSTPVSRHCMVLDYEQGRYVFLCYLTLSGLGSSVGIATDYGLDCPGSNPGGYETFRPPRPALGPPSLLYNGYRVFPRG